MKARNAEQREVGRLVVAAHLGRALHAEHQLRRHVCKVADGDVLEVEALVDSGSKSKIRQLAAPSRVSSTLLLFTSL